MILMSTLKTAGNEPWHTNRFHFRVAIISLRLYIYIKALKSRFLAQIFFLIQIMSRTATRTKFTLKTLFLRPQTSKTATQQTKNDIRFLRFFFPSWLFIKSLQLCGVLFKSERKDDRRLLLLAGSSNPVSHFPRLTLIAQGTSWEWRNEATVFLQPTLKSSNSADFQISF